MAALDSVLEVGAGIGRVTQNILLKRFKRVDVMEPSKVLMSTLKNNLDGS